MTEVVAGVDLGGTGSRFVILGPSGVLASDTIETATFTARDVEERLSRLAASVQGLVPACLTLKAVGVGASGPVDREAGVVRNCDTLPMFSDFDLVGGLERRLGVPVTIDNDAVVAAVAEQRLGAGAGAARMLMVTLGTGIGVAFLVDGEPFRGPGGAHPEAGHIPINGAFGRCYCGAEGCWEQAASRSALQAMLSGLVSRDVAERDLVNVAMSLSAEPRIRDVFGRYGYLVGQGLATLHTVYMPDVTVLGGSAASSLHRFADGLHDALARAPGFAMRTEVRGATLGDTGGAIGAALTAWDRGVRSTGLAGVLVRNSDR